MKKALSIFIFLTLFTLQFNHAFAQPANDFCSNAITLTSATTCSYVEVTAPGGTESIPGTTTPGTDDDDVWYSFTAQAATHVITVDGVGSYDAVVELRSGSCVGTGVQNVDGSGVGGIETLTVNGLTVGNTYLIRVYHFGTGDGGGMFDICVTHTAPPAGPANDVCGNATIIQSSTTCVNTFGTTVGATQSIAGSCSGTPDDDVWYRFVAQAANHTVTVTGFGGFDAVVDIRNAPACSASNIMCVDNSSANGTETANLTGLVVGATYVVRVYHFGTGSTTGNFDICVTHTAPPSGPANDICGSAVSLTSSLTCNNTAGTTTGATQSLAGTCAGTGDDDVWYSFTAVATSHTVKVTGSSGFDAVIDIRSSTSCTGTNISCTDGSGTGGTETANLTGLTVGTTYLIRVYHFTAGSGSGNFDICVTHTAPPAPSNDFCANATSITSALTCNYTSGSTSGATQTIAGTCSGTGDDDVWYSFTAVATDHTIKVQGGTGFDPVIDVRSGACTGTNLSCTDATGGAGLETANLTGLTVGSTYYVRVYHFGTGSGGGNFQICITHTVPSAPTNDLCTSAISLTSATSCSYTNGSTTGATQSIPGTCGGTGDDDVWYSFTAVATSHKVTVQGAAGFDAVIDIRTSPTCSGTNVLCSDNSGGGGIETANLTGLTIGNTYMVRVYHYAAGAGSGNFQICVTHTTSSCTYSISPTNLSFTSAGGTGTVTVTTTGSCNWTATTSDSWITITSGSGTGNGTVTYTVAANSGTAQRTGTITIGGQTHTVAQSGNTSCTYTVSPLSQTFTSAAGNGTVTVTTTGSCNWAATSNDSWITITSGGSGTGNGTVTYSISSNTTTSQRVGTITIAGQVYTVTQNGTIPCSYTISPTNLSFASSGGNGTITVTASGGCNWTATTTDSWITITSGSSGSGNGTVTYTVAANSGTAQRTGSITIGGQTHTVAQSGVTSCTFTISPLNQTFTSAAGNGTVTVTAANGCNWAATSNDSWITVTSGSTGSGNGTVTYTITANSGAQRVGTITIAGQVHSITQSGVSPCSYAITPSSLSFSASGGPGSVTVTAAPGCNWTATSNDAWITITSGGTGSGNGSVNYTVANNTTTTQRTGTITVAGQTHTVTQNGLQCTYTISPTALSYTAAAGTGTVNVTAAAGCTWTATTTDSWITITSGTGTGTGTAGYSVSANTGTSQRLGSITVAGQTHTVVQNGTSSCSYTLTPSSQTFTAIAGTGSFNVTASSGCNWTAISNDSWIFISSGNTGSGNGTVNFSVDASTSTSQRTGTITVGGQIYTITQSGIVCPATPVMQSVGCSLAANLISNVNYQWYISGTPIIGATSQFYTANQPGFYSVFVTDITNGCTASSQPAYVACSGVGVEEFNLADAINIYPNPSSGSFNIISSGIFTSENVKISIINVYGQSVYATHIVPQNGEIKLTVNDAVPAKGTYTVLFTSGSTQVAKRIIIN
ncbi:MAG: BACON domain-containing carbohydrate-binding protein [Bacteroidia bacterium]